MALIDEYISKISQDTQADKQGGSHKCYLMGQYALIKGAFYESDMGFIIEKTKKLSDENVAVVPTLDYKKIKDIKGFSDMFLGFVLQRRAKGEELHKTSFPYQLSEEYYSRISELAKRPQEFFDKYVSDWLKICKSGLQIDASKSANFFYTPEQIYFIDLTKSKNAKRNEYAFHESAVALFNGGAYYKFTNHDEHKFVLNKLVNAFAANGESVEKMREVSSMHFADIADYALKDVEKKPCIMSKNKERE